MQCWRLYFALGLFQAYYAFLVVHNKLTSFHLNAVLDEQKVARRPVSLAKRALLKAREPPASVNKPFIEVTATVDQRLRAFDTPEIQQIMKEQGVTAKELLALSDAVMSGQYNPYNRNYTERHEKTKSIKAAKKEAKLLSKSNETHVTPQPRDPRGLSPPAPRRPASEVKRFNEPFISQPLVGLPPPGDYQRWPSKENKDTQSRDSLVHDVSLKDMLSYLIERIGFPALYRATNLRCFFMEPSLISSLKCLRSTSLGWAREKIEALYLENKRKDLEGKESQSVN